MKHERFGVANSETGFRSYNTTVQVGLDHAVNVDSGRVILDTTVERMEGDTNYHAVDGTGSTDRTALSLYGTLLSENDFYADVLKASKLSSEFDVRADDFRAKADYDRWAFGVSLEVGKRFERDIRWFLKPQVHTRHVGGLCRRSEPR